jgi:hypothetical protein
MFRNRLCKLLVLAQSCDERIIVELVMTIILALMIIIIPNSSSVPFLLRQNLIRFVVEKRDSPCEI